MREKNKIFSTNVKKVGLLDIYSVYKTTLECLYKRLPTKP